jgi:hypothetical protein
MFIWGNKVSADTQFDVEKNGMLMAGCYMTGENLCELWSH